MFGPSMMIAPVYTYKATSREVYFPKGTDWYDLYTGKRYKGGQKQEVEAPFERMPIFAPSGGILLYGPEITQGRQYLILRFIPFTALPKPIAQAGMIGDLPVTYR